MCCDNFCKEFDTLTQDKLLTGLTSGKRGPSANLSLSEIMTILIMFHQVRFRDFKTTYTGFLAHYWKSYFPNLQSYCRFISIMKNAIFPLTIYTQLHAGKQTGVYYIDSSCLPVCHLKHGKRHKTFDLIAQYGRTSVGWFFGLKLHIVTNDRGELMVFKLTKGKRHDSGEVVSLLSQLKGLAFGDKGYIGQKLFDTLFEKGLKLTTRQRKHMKKKPSTDYEKQLLNQRGIIETVIGHLKHHYQVWHTRHRSPLNALTHLVAALAVYTIEPLKISAIKIIANLT